MKFRIEKKDLIIFILFCLLLLYLCAIAVLNFSSFANESEFYGLNPFPAFGPDYIMLTLFMFAVALILIFSSVSSYIFERDKGAKRFIDISPKSDKGYSRWATEKEMKSDTDVEKVILTDEVTKAGGIPLINNGKEAWVDNSEYHTLVIGSSGSGKTACIVKPTVNFLAKSGESMIINDPKGEIFEYSSGYLKSKGYNVVVLNFRDTARGNSWNPLYIPYSYYKEGKKDKAIELLRDVANNIIVDPKASDPFWGHAAAEYFEALALGLFEFGKEDEININSINSMVNIGEEKLMGKTFAQHFFKYVGEDSIAYNLGAGTFNTAQDTKSGVISTFKEKLNIFSTQEGLSEMLSNSDFDMRKIGEDKTAVFLIIQDEKKTYHSLLTIFLKQCYETLIDVAQNSEGNKLKYRTNFLLDEFANMPALADVDAMVSAARSRKIRFTFIIQNFAQLEQVYGKQIASTLKGNCGNLIYLISQEMEALQEISKMCGEVKSKDKDKTASTPLVTITDLQKMKLFQAIIIRLRMSPFKVQYTPEFKINWGHDKFPYEYPNREVGKVKTFSIKNFVNEQREKEMKESMGGNDDNPFLSNTNPFQFPKSQSNPFLDSPFTSSKSSSNPFTSQSNPFAADMFGMPNEDNSTIKDKFGDLGIPNTDKPISALSNEEIDKMIADIDKKLAELDAEEKENGNDDSKFDVTSFELPPLSMEEEEKRSNMELPKLESEVVEEAITKPVQEVVSKPVVEEKNKLEKLVEEQPKKIESLESLDDDKPRINVDEDSIVMNDNLVSDDEFFDDFFDE